MGYRFLFLFSMFSFVFAQVQELQVAGSGFFGATFEEDPIPENLAYDVPADAIVKTIIAGSPAEAAGIKVGDLILATDGFGVDGAQKMVHYLARKKSGESLECFLLRNDPEQEREVSMTITLTLGSFPTASLMLPPAFGMSLKKEGESFLVHQVLPGSSAYKARIQVGDQLLNLDGQAFVGSNEDTLADFLRSLDTQREKPVELVLLRQNQEVKITLTPNRKGHIGLFLYAGKKGAVVIDELFPNGPAQKAGLQVGDQILKIGEESIRRGQRIGEIIVEKGKGTELAFEIKRADQTLKLNVIVGGRAGY